MATVKREKRFNTAQGILYLLADGDNCIEIYSAKETVREFEVDSIEKRDRFFDFCAMNLFVYSAKGLLSDPDRFWEVIEKIEEAEESRDLSLKDVTLDFDGAEESLPKVKVSYRIEGRNLKEDDIQLSPGGFSIQLENGEVFSFDFRRHYGNSISKNESSFVVDTLELENLVDMNDYFPLNWDEFRQGVMTEVFLYAVDENGKEYGTGYGAKVTGFEIVSEDDLRIYYQMDEIGIERINTLQEAN